MPRTSKVSARPGKETGRRAATSKPRKSNSKPSMAKRQMMIAEAAYYRAEQRNFTPGFEEFDWLEAEKEIESRLGIP